MRIKSCVLPLVVIACAAFVAVGQSKKITHAEAVSVLKSCMEKSFEICTEDSVDQVMKRYWAGDSGLLRPLLGLRRIADGALGEELSSFNGDMLVRRPLVFLQALSHLPRKEQDELILYTSVNGLNSEGRSRVTRNLKRIAKENQHLSRLAIRSLLVIDDGRTYPNTGNK